MTGTGLVDRHVKAGQEVTVQELVLREKILKDAILLYGFLMTGLAVGCVALLYWQF